MLSFNPKLVFTLSMSFAMSFAVMAGNPSFSKVVAEVDTNHDGKMSRKEWMSAGLPDSSFNMFECGRDFVVEQDYIDNAAPEGIDMNGDGYLTVAEFKAFDKKMSANMAQGGPPSGPPPGPAPGSCNK